MIKLALTALPLASIMLGRLKRRLVTSLMAGLLLLMALFWGSVAGFLALVPVWGAPAAAGVVGGGFLLLALLVWLVGRRGGGAVALPMQSTATMAATTGAVAGAASPTLLAALLAGYMAGRGR